MDAQSALPSPQRITISDVASRANVSIATVSRVMNGRYGVAKGTTKRVQEAIDALGYESSLVARSLRSQRTNVIGVLVTDIEPYSAEVLKGVARALRQTDYELIVYSGFHSADEVGWERRYMSRLSGTLTDGTVLVTPTVTGVPTDQPVVAVDPQAGSSAFPTFASQNLQGALAATRHLTELGHRRIGFLGGRSDLQSARIREAGYCQGLAEAGIEFDPLLCVDGGFTASTADAPTRALLELDERPTAIFAANDASAIQVIKTATDLGLQVPNELSVVGFDNVPESALTNPPLTTVDQSIQELGYLATRTLILMIDEPDSSDVLPQTTLPTSLVVRQSTAKPLASTT